MTVKELAHLTRLVGELVGLTHNIKDVDLKMQIYLKAQELESEIVKVVAK